MSTDSNKSNIGSTTLQKQGIVFITPSTLSTAINKCQHMSTKALASNSSVKGYYLRVCWLSKPHQQRQQTATTATEEEQNFTETWHCLCNTINTVNSHQHKSTPVNKGFGQQYFREETLSLSLLALKTTSTMSRESNNCNRGATTSQKHSIVFVTLSTLSTAINKCQHLSTRLWPVIIP